MKKEICECGHDITWHTYVKPPECDHDDCSCKKFKASQGMTQEVPQNHSPAQHIQEDKEPELHYKNPLRGVEEQAGSDNQSLSDERKIIDWNRMFKKDIKKLIEYQDKKAVSKLKEEFKEYLHYDKGVNDVDYIIDKIFGKELSE